MQQLTNRISRALATSTTRSYARRSLLHAKNHSQWTRASVELRRSARRHSTLANTDAELSSLLAEWHSRRQNVAESSDLLARVRLCPAAEPHGVFCNADVWLGNIDCYGFDCDFTLVHYSDQLHEFIYDAALRNLVEKQRYPETLRSLRFDSSFPVRGVHFDPLHATLIKVDATQHVEVAFKGRKQLTRDQIAKLYPSHGHCKYDRLSEMRFLVDQFCYSEICLLADVVQYLETEGLSYDPAHIYHDCVTAISDVHRSGAMYREIERDLQAYIVPNPKLRTLFERLKAHDKRIFILTNSPWTFVNSAMTHVCGADWRRLVDLVICSANKPEFYTSSRPFRRIFADTGRVDWSPVSDYSALSGGVLMGGNLHSLVEMTDWHRRVLFTGDNIHSDSRDPRRFGWRTAMVLPETARDVEVNNSDDYRVKLTTLMEAKDFLSNIFDVRRSYDDAAKDRTRLAIETEMETLRAEIRQLFGSPFGSVYSCDTQSSLFGMRAARWTDLYMSSIDNFLQVNHDAYLSPRATTKMLPHGCSV